MRVEISYEIFGIARTTILVVEKGMTLDDLRGLLALELAQKLTIHQVRASRKGSSVPPVKRGYVSTLPKPRFSSDEGIKPWRPDISPSV